MEDWKDVVGYEGLYQVSSLGNIKSVKRIDVRGMPRGGFLMKQSVNCKNKYFDIYLCLDGHKKRWKIHMLVALAFHGAKPDVNSVCRHLDGNKANNVVGNVAWGSQKDNCADRDLHGTTARGERNGGGAKLTGEQAAEIRARVNAGEIGAELAREFGVLGGVVCHIKKGRNWSHV